MFFLLPLLFSFSIWEALCSSSLNQKPFEFTVEEGGMFYQLRIYERGRDSLKSIFMGKRMCKEIAVHSGRTDRRTVSWSVCEILP